MRRFRGSLLRQIGSTQISSQSLNAISNEWHLYSKLAFGLSCPTLVLPFSLPSLHGLIFLWRVVLSTVFSSCTYRFYVFSVDRENERGRKRKKEREGEREREREPRIRHRTTTEFLFRLFFAYHEIHDGENKLNDSLIDELLTVVAPLTANI